MNWALGVLLAVLGLLAGLGLGLAIAARRMGSREPSAPPPPPAVAVPPGARWVLDVIRSAGVVVGPHDEVLESTQLALQLGLTRGSRVVITEVLDLVRETRQTQRSQDTELAIRRLPGDLRDADIALSVRAAPMPGGLILVLADDLTAVRRAEATRRDFVANVGHELKTPIGAISLLAEAVEEAADDPEAVRRFATRMGIEAARLGDLVSQILDLSRLQAHDPLGEVEPIAIDSVLNEAVDRCRVDAERHQVTITIAGERGLRVLGDHLQLSIAVGNLVENALVYSDPGARVVVAARSQVHGDADLVGITVSDNGIGIPADQLGRIFERFYRVDYARSRANGGSGLGLAIVKHVAAAHHGDVTVWSQPGRGSTFTLRLPRFQTPGQAGPGEDPESATMLTTP